MTGFVGSGLVLLGVTGALVGPFLWRRARKQLEWEAVPGTVCTARIVGGEFYEAQIEYTYTFRGRAFRGTKVRSLTVLTNWRGPAQRVVEKYPPGSTVTVFVNPENPWDAVLERGGDPKFCCSVDWPMFRR
jgi:hypothetical protein